MIKNEIQYSNSFRFNNYLSECDLCYKYLLKSRYKKPYIHAIKLNLDLQSILTTGDGKGNLYVRTLFFLYSVFLINPKINIITKTTSNLQNQVDPVKTCLQIIFYSEEQKNNFLFFYFIELWSKLVKTKWKLKVQESSINYDKDKVVLHSNILFKDLNNFSTFYDFAGSHFVSDPILSIKFNFINIDFKFIQKGIKNLPFFWKVK